MLRYFIGGLLAMAVVGCTTYQDGSASFWSSPTTLVVSGSGNEFTDADRVNDFVFLQAAEKALEFGYGYFVKRGQADTSETQSNTIYTPPNANYAGGVNTYHTVLPGMDAVFEMYEVPPEGFREGQYFDALEIYHRLGPQYLGDAYDAARGIN